MYIYSLFDKDVISSLKKKQTMLANAIMFISEYFKSFYNWIQHSTLLLNDKFPYNLVHLWVRNDEIHMGKQNYCTICFEMVAIIWRR